MPESVDGDIRLKVGLSTRDAKQAANDLKQTLLSVFGPRTITNIGTTTKQVQALESKMDKAQKKVYDLAMQMDQLRDKKIPTEDYKTWQSELDESYKRLNSLNEQLKTVEESGKGKGKTAKLEALKQQIAETKAEIQDLQLYLRDMEKEGTAFQNPVNTQEYQDLALKLAEANTELEKLTEEERRAGEAAHSLDTLRQEAEISDEYIAELTRRLEELKARQKELASAGIGLGHLEFDENEAEIAKITSELAEYRKSLRDTSDEESRFSKVKGVLKKAFVSLSGAIKKCATELVGFNKHAKQSATHSNTLGRTLKSLLGYGIGIGSLAVAFNKLRGAIQEGLGNLAKESTSVSSSLSSLTSALATLKNALASAFAPILTVVTPILTNFINFLTNVISKIGMLIAALTGASVFKKAKKVQQDYGKAIGGTTKKTKELNKETQRTLSSIDELNVISSDALSPDDTDGGGGGGGINPQDMFEDVDIPDSIKKLAERIKDLFRKVWEPFKLAWAKEGANTIKAAKFALTSVWNLIKDIGRSFLAVWTNGTGQKMLELLLKILQDIFNFIGNIAEAIDRAWKKNDIGTKIIQAIFDILNKALEWIHKIAKATADWAKELDFYPLLESFYNLLKAIEPLVDSIGKLFYNLWTQNVLPAVKWLIETGLPTMIDFISNVIVPALESITDLISEHPGILLAIAGAIGLIVGAIKLDAALIAIGKIMEASVLLPSIMSGIVGAVSFIVSFVGGLITGLIGMITDVVLGFVGFVTQTVAPLLIKAFSDVAMLIANVFKVAFSAIWTGLQALAAFFGVGVGWIIAAIGLVIAAIVIWIKNWDDIKEAVKLFVEEAKYFLEDLWQGITNICQKIGDTFKSAWDNIVEGFKTVVVGGIKSALNGLIGIVESAINGVLKALSAIDIDIPEWIPGVGGKHFGFNFGNVSLPRLAKGAVIPPNRSFLAMLGDQTSGNNLEAPESLIRQIVREEAGDNAQQMQMFQQMVQYLQIISQRKFGITNNEIFESVRGSANSYLNRTGNSAF